MSFSLSHRFFLPWILAFSGMAGVSAEGGSGATETGFRRIAETIRQSEYQITFQSKTATPGQPGALHAANRAQNLRAYFRPEGWELFPRTESAPSWNLRVSLHRETFPGSLLAATAIQPRSRQFQITYDRNDISEFFENTPAGIRWRVEVKTRFQGPGTEIRFRTETGLTPILNRRGDEIRFHQAGRPVVRLKLLASRDSGGRPAPARFHLEKDSLSLVFETDPFPRRVALEMIVTGGSAAPGSSPLSPLPDWDASGGQAGALFGASHATAGDIDGDGYSDFLVAAPGFDGGQIDEGKVFLYLGSPSGPTLIPVWTFEGDQANARLGTSVSPAGDTNGDQFQDFLIGAPDYDAGGIDSGAAFLFFGSPTGPAAVPDWSAAGNRMGARLGASVSLAGDVDGDRFDDILVGIPGDPPDRGSVALFPGGNSGPALSPGWTAAGDQDAAGFGTVVAAAGDVNGDGLADFLIGAPDRDSPLVDSGQLFLYLGAPAGLGFSLGWTGSGDQAGARFGLSAASVGDFDGDGFGDILVGAPFHDGQWVDEGAVYLFPGGSFGPAPAPLWIREGGQNGARFGFSLATAGDVNGDGYGDAVIGAPGLADAAGNSGGAFLFPGGPGGGAGVPAWTASGGMDGASFGAWVGTAGDVNGDGFSDLLVGAPHSGLTLADEGKVLLYMGSAAGPATGAVWMATGGQVMADFGYSVASAGDVNGDGYSDVIVGAPGFDGGEIDEGRVFLFHGSPDGVSIAADWTAEGNRANARFGESVAAAGDIDGDGFGDLIVGAPAFTGLHSDEGAAFLFRGSSSGLAATPQWMVQGNLVAARFGFSVASAGDINGDGFGDVIIGAFSFSNQNANEGRAFLFRGSALGLAIEPSWVVDGQDPGAGLGVSVATAGDVNGDGFSDVIIGAWLADNGQVNEGRAFVYTGSLNGLALLPDWTAEGDQDKAKFGNSVGTAGDVNGDGFSDVIVGAFTFTNGESEEGRVFLYNGAAAGLSPSPSWIAEGNQPGARFGGSVATAGDVNGDGFSDVIIGARFFDNGEANEGMAFVYAGSPEGLATSPIWVAEGDQQDALFGWSVAAAGDVNGDGFGDVMVGAPLLTVTRIQEGKSFLYLGNEDGGLDRVPRQTQADGISPIGIRGWTDSLAVQLQLLGRHPGGRGRVGMEWEIAPLDTPFPGLPIMGNTKRIDSGPAGAVSGSSVLLQALISGLTAGTPYRWRARVATDSPLFPRSPWLSLPDIPIREYSFRTPECRDIDQDGFGSPGDSGCPAGDSLDCDDMDASIFPGAVEICDSVDNDCDGSIDLAPDESPLQESCYTGPGITLGVGICQEGLATCFEGHFGACLNQVTPQGERCGQLDWDCDGVAGNTGGDVDGSGRVDGGDLTEWASRLGTSLNSDPDSPFFLEYRRAVDFDGDGDVDGRDLLIILVDFGRTRCTP